MTKKYSLKFWLIFWTISIIFLTGWYFYWNTRNSGLKTLEKIVDIIPIKEENRDTIKALAFLSDYFINKTEEEKTFLVLFQNNMEIRPGGGFIGAFGILKVKNGKVSEFQIHDTGNFDGRIPDTQEPPYPMKETLKIDSWKLRDSNFSPDFEENAKKAEEFYYLGNGQEKFDGVIGITADVLTSFLKVTGPIELENYPGTYADENAILSLEYQVEKAYVDQGIEKGERKSVINDLGRSIISKISELNNERKVELSKIIFEDLKQKKIQMVFKDEELQNKIREANWDGNMDKNWEKDYLMVVDANLGAFKSDYYIKRDFYYKIDLSGEKPKATLKITYKHTASQKDWMTKDYITYLRVYVPKGSWLEKSKNFESPRFGEEFDKKYFASIVKVPLGQTRTVELEYFLPEKFSDNYNLKVQKQIGLKDIPVTIEVISKNKKDLKKEITINSDITLDEISK